MDFKDKIGCIAVRVKQHVKGEKHIGKVAACDDFALLPEAKTDLFESPSGRVNEIVVRKHCSGICSTRRVLTKPLFATGSAGFVH